MNFEYKHCMQYTLFFCAIYMYNKKLVHVPVYLNYLKSLYMAKLPVLAKLDYKQP